MTTELAATGTIEIRTRFFPLAFILFLCTPRIVIDGAAPVKRGWGTSSFTVSPGRHHVEVYFPYLFLRRCGANSVDVDVQAGDVVLVSFYMPPLIFARGSMSVDAPRAQLPSAKLVG